MNAIKESGRELVQTDELTARCCSPHWLDEGVAVVDAEGLAVSLNDGFAKWFGEAAKALEGKPFWPRLWQMAPEWEAELRPVIEARQPWTTVELGCTIQEVEDKYQLQLAANASGWFVRLVSVLPPPTEMGEAGWSEYLRHPGARRDLFMRLLRAEAQLDNLIYRWPGVIFTQRSDFSFHFVSPRIEELTGVPPSEWRTQPQRFWQVVHEADGDELQQHLKRCVQAQRSLSMTFRIRHARTGRVAYVLEHRKALVAGNGVVLGYEGVWLDVTRQVIAEKRLTSAAWKETLAVITMGLAHDFSNIMAGILSLSESFLSQVEPDHPFREGLGLIKHNSLQAHQLVHRIINLHHGKTGTSQYCDLNAQVQDLVDLIRKILPRRIEVVTELGKLEMPLYLDPVEFRQVVINLALNAADAMPHTGRLVLRTSLHEKLPDLAVMRGAPPRLPAVGFSMEDSGCGIKARHLPSIFDPFYTTKPMNKGSGLGLYNTRLFVEKHQGAVSVETREGRGTTFHLWLPCADFSEEERLTVEGVGRRRSLLVAGRADGPVETTAEFLRCHGYHVVVATAEADARELLESADYQFVGLMILADPKEAGLTALLAEAQRRKPPLKTVLQLVGCSADEVETDLMRRADILILPDLSETDILRRLDQGLPLPAYEPPPAL